MSNGVEHMLENYAHIHSKHTGKSYFGSPVFKYELWFQGEVIMKAKGSGEPAKVELMRNVMHKLNESTSLTEELLTHPEDGRYSEVQETPEAEGPNINYDREPADFGFFRFSGGPQDKVFLHWKNPQDDSDIRWYEFRDDGSYDLIEWAHIDISLEKYDLIPLQRDSDSDDNYEFNDDAATHQHPH
jgi:hypothetical protein